MVDETKHNRESMPYALEHTKRCADLGSQFRETPDVRDELDETRYPRTPYHRDRDRIIWSKAFKRLQNKTQVFPHYVRDHYKRRLTHSIEVAGIATSLARRLGLNEIATEAIGLGHDIGHTPFGHAGEEALNEFSLSKHAAEQSSNQVPLRGFNHCAHAIEVVARIEQLKMHHVGLNLTFDVRDGILKHIYDSMNAAELEEKPLNGLGNIIAYPLYQQYAKNCGSLEAQCVWFADKLCYLLGDIEDGIRANILSRKELVGHAFITKAGKLFEMHIEAQVLDRAERMRKEYEDMRMASMDLMDRYYFLRNKAITVAMENCVVSTKRRLAENQIGDVQAVLTCPIRIVDVSEDLRQQWREFYRDIMEERLFRDIVVVEANYRAKHIVMRLVECYCDNMKLVPPKYRCESEKVYKDLVGTSDMLDFVVARNYVAGMTDSFAIQQYEKFFGQIAKAGL